MAMAVEVRQHVEEYGDEIAVEDGERGAATGDWEGGEPSKNGGARLN